MIRLGYEDTIFGLIGGFFLSLFSLYVGMKLQRRREKEKELENSMREFYRPLCELIDDVVYALSLQIRSEFDTSQYSFTMSKIKEKLPKIESSYVAFQDKGYDVTMQSFNQELCNELKGFFNLLRSIGKNKFEDHLNYRVQLRLTFLPVIF